MSHHMTVKEVRAERTADLKSAREAIDVAVADGEVYRCANPFCGNTFLHGAQEECPRDENGFCAHLSGGGWVNVQVVVRTDKREKNKMLFATGGWLCKSCAERYGAR